MTVSFLESGAADDGRMVKRFDASIVLGVVSIPGGKQGRLAFIPLFQQGILSNPSCRVKRFDAR
ncbi:hypothetical protein AB0D89_11485 [Streptomyces luteogriseus]|uniref:hypothetical protein n=1 Tax=Streptomyces luteogriseus TaxID=68233 RepID=UPI0033F2F814